MWLLDRDFPSTLTHLEITQYHSTISELMNALMGLAHGCPALKNFELAVKLYDGVYLEEMFSTLELQSDNRTPPFQSMLNQLIIILL